MLFRSRLFLLVTFISTALAAPARQGTAVQIEDDIKAIETAFTTLNNDIINFSGLLSQASIINTDAATVSSLSKSALVDVQTPDSDLPLSGADANTIVSLASGLVPLIKSTLQNLVAKKPNFDKLEVSGLVASGLNDVGSNVIKLADAFWGKAPADLQDQVAALDDQIKVAFATAEKAYPSA